MKNRITTWMVGICLTAVALGCASAGNGQSVQQSEQALWWLWGGSDDDEVREIRVASVQIANVNHDTAGNLQKAGLMVSEAVENGADLVLLPELFACGYLYTEEMWDGAESMDGMTVGWMKQTASQHDVWLGGTFLEADGRHFYNTFVLIDRQGDVAGTVRKQVAAGVEAFVFKEDSTSHVIETDELGTVGVGICYENYLCSLPDEMILEEVDLMLMPHSYPSVSFLDVLGPNESESAGQRLLSELGLEGSALDPQAAIEQLFEQIELELNIAQQLMGGRMAGLLGVPAVTANKVGEFVTGLPPVLGDAPAEGFFTGQSGIFDAEGTVLQQLDMTEEGLAISDIVMDPSLKQSDMPRCFSGPTSRHWFNREMFEGLDLLRIAFFIDPFSVVEEIGILSYMFDGNRLEAACDISDECLFF